MSEQNMCDRLAAYELGALESEDRRAFEDHLRDCAECQDELYDHAPAAALLASAPGTWARRMAATTPRPSLAQRLASWLRPPLARALVPVATVALLALVLLQPWQGPVSPWSDLAVVEALPWTGQQVRSGADDAERAFAAAMELYVARDWADAGIALADAAGALAASGAPSALHDQARLYAGVSHLLADDATAAASQLELASTSALPPVAQRATWNLAQARLLLDDPDGALAALSSLESSPVYAARAGELAATIHERR
ncbi:MAG: zf-HC2 domain-containing protein [bacterium]|nr:zf-HC2 domain-containing protein [bacterium]